MDPQNGLVEVGLSLQEVDTERLATCPMVDKWQLINGRTGFEPRPPGLQTVGKPWVLWVCHQDPDEARATL